MIVTNDAQFTPEERQEQWRHHARALLLGVRATLEQRGKIELDLGGRPLLAGIALLLGDAP